MGFDEAVTDKRHPVAVVFRGGLIHPSSQTAVQRGDGGGVGQDGVLGGERPEIGAGGPFRHAL